MSRRVGTQRLMLAAYGDSSGAQYVVLPDPLRPAPHPKDIIFAPEESAKVTVRIGEEFSTRSGRYWLRYRDPSGCVIARPVQE